MSNTKTIKINRPEIYDEFVARASFDTNPEQSKKSLSVNIDVTKQELDSLFGTKMYERPYLPEYYNPLEELLGELWTTAFESIALQSVVDKIHMFIPYLEVDQANTTFTYENYKLTMNLIFYYKYDFNKTLYNYERQFDTVT